MTLKSIFEQFITEPDFRASQHEMCITPAQHLKFLLAQAIEDKHFRLDSIVQHQIRFGDYAKSKSGREGVPESLGGSGASTSGGRDRQSGDGREQERINRKVHRGGDS